MKKLLALVLSVIMVAGLFAGCNGDKDKDKKSSSGAASVKVNKDGKIDLTITYDTIGEESKKVAAKVGSGKHVQSILIPDENATIYVPAGKTATLKYTINPSDAADPSVYFESSNTDIVKVDKDGKVLGIEAGCTTVKIITNDRNFKASVKVVVYRVDNDETKIAEMLSLINKARTDAGLTELPESKILTRAATERAFEEAAEGDGKMDDTRVLKDAEGNYKTQSTVYSDYGIYVRGSAQIYSWGDTYDTVKTAYDAIVKNEDNKKTLLSADGEYSYIGIGCFKSNDITYWCIMLYLE